MSATPSDEIRHEDGARHGAFFVEKGGRRVAELTYNLAGDTAVVGHTWVDPTLRGGTLAPSLVAAAVAWARKENRKISPVCSYVRRVMDRAPEAYKDIRHP